MNALGRKQSLLAATLIAIACGGGEAPSPDPDAGGASGGPGADTIATAPQLPDSVGELPGEPVDFGPREGDALAVVGIAHDDALRLRAAPGEDQEVLSPIGPTQTGLIARGRTRSVPGGVWTLVDRGGTLGWVNLRDVAYIGDTYDATADRLSALDARPSAGSMAELGRIVTESMRSPDAEGAARIVVVVDETVGDLGEITFDLIGLADDSLRGYRVHVFGEPVDGGFVLRNVEVTNLCGRGVGQGMLCL